MKTTHLTIIITLFIILASGFSPAYAQGRWAQNHPRRAEVNSRLALQNQRIHQERRSGEISGLQAFRMHLQDRQIRRGERLMARHNGGHITRQQQHRLNRQENRVSKEISF